MFEHKYDESGLPTTYVTLTIVIPLLSYKLYSLFRAPGVFVCNCRKCRENKARESHWKDWVAISILVAILSILIRNLMTLTIQNKVEGFSPYVVLGIDENTTLKTVKRRYKKLLRPLFMLAKDPETREEAEKAMTQINKAYDLVKDPVNYQNWIMSQTRSELFVALPQFILEFSRFSFALYFFIMALIIPVLIYGLLYRKRPKTSNRVFYETSEQFLEDCKDIVFDNRTHAIQSILFRLSQSKDFKSHIFQADLSHRVEEVQRALETTFKIPLISSDSDFMQIISVLCRLDLSSAEDQSFVISKSLGIIEIFKEIAFVCKTQLYEVILDVENMFIQVVTDPKYFMLQYPGIKDAALPGQKVKNYQISEEDLTQAVEDPECLKQAMKVYESIPSVEISNAEAYNYNEEEMQREKIENAKKIRFMDKCFVVDCDLNSFLSFDVKISSPNEVKLIHAPYLKETKSILHTIYIKMNGTLIEDKLDLKDFQEQPFKILLPEKKGIQLVEIICKATGYFAPVVKETLRIKYK